MGVNILDKECYVLAAKFKSKYSIKFKYNIGHMGAVNPDDIK